MKGNRGSGNREGGFDLLTPQHALELAGKSVYSHFRENICNNNLLSFLQSYDMELIFRFHKIVSKFLSP